MTRSLRGVMGVRLDELSRRAGPDLADSSFAASLQAYADGDRGIFVEDCARDAQICQVVQAAIAFDLFRVLRDVVADAERGKTAR
ncbi:hypothetical protein [Roseobacter sp. HKCCA0434]|uniref:hypothetical protein n=1 Tax=Roseobacter sp. HKCCA0434 TaxID=3079297 RepID=UPI002905E972|nr:hypothetical protein [Roseobacter sp. HKCCA0434]